MEDALNATRAVEEGVVIGGGCVSYAAQDLDGVKVKGDDQKAGVEIVKAFKLQSDKLLLTQVSMAL